MKLIDPIEISKIIEDFVNGDEAKFNELYKLTWRHVYFAIVRRAGDGENMKDLLQEVYIQVYKSVHKLDDKQSFLAWVDRVIINKYIDQKRVEQKHLLSADYEKKVSELVEEDKDYIPEEKALQKEEHAELHKIINELPETYRQIIKMFYFDELSSVEIAKILGIPENVVRKRLFDARKKIKKKAEALSENYRDKYNVYSLAGAPILISILVDELIESSIFANLIENSHNALEIGKIVANEITNETAKEIGIQISQEIGKEVSKETIKKVTLEATNQTLKTSLKTQLQNIVTPLTNAGLKVVGAKSIAIGTLSVALASATITYVATNYEKNNNDQKAIANLIEEKITPINSHEAKTEPLYSFKTQDLKEEIATPKDNLSVSTQTQTPQIEQKSQQAEITDNFLSSEIATQSNATNHIQSQNTQTENNTQEIPTQELTTEPLKEEIVSEKTKLPAIILTAKINYETNYNLTSERFIKDIYHLVGNSFELTSGSAETLNSDVNTKVKGVYNTKILALKDLTDNQEMIIDVVVTIGDQTPPKIEILQREIKTKINQKLNEEQIIQLSNLKITDNSDGDLLPIFFKLENVDWEAQGEYLVYAETKDEEGNYSERLSILIIVE